MRKIMAWMLTAAMLFSLVGCNKGGNRKTDASKSGGGSSAAGPSASSSKAAGRGTSSAASDLGVDLTGGADGTDAAGLAGVDLGLGGSDDDGDWFSQFGIIGSKDVLTGSFSANYPIQGDMTYTRTPTFSWTSTGSAVSYRLRIEQLVKNRYVTVLNQGIKGNSYKLSKPLQYGATYRYMIEAVRKDGSTQKAANLPSAGANFMCLADAKNNPVNKGMDFRYSGGISEKVLKNYLSRIMVDGIFDTLTTTGRDQSYMGDNIRMIFNTGAKYVSRAYCPWQPDSSEFKYFPTMKAQIQKLHTVDPDIVFEACIFETSGGGIDSIPVPAYVFRAFGQPVVKRNFSHAKMDFPDGTYKDVWAAGLSCPDIRQLETQMFIYYRATMFIDLGFEGLHLGQTNMVAKKDPGNAGYAKVIGMIRSYAKTHARRHWVLINSMHGADFDLKDKRNHILEDFTAFPVFMRASTLDIMHPPTKDWPQQTFINLDDPHTLLQKSTSGTTPSGWKTSHLPYKLELDNFMTGDISNINQPGIDHWPWGLDEISWFANQPDNYRRFWLGYAYKRIHQLDPNGFFEMPGKRIAFLEYPSDPWNGEGKFYYANSRTFSSYGFGDETQIKNIWYQSNPNR